MNELIPVDQRLPQIYSIYDPAITTESLVSTERIERVPQFGVFSIPVWPVRLDAADPESMESVHAQMWGTFSAQDSEFVIAGNDDCMPRVDALYKWIQERAKARNLAFDGVWQHNTGRHRRLLGIYDYARGVNLVRFTLMKQREYLQSHPS